VKKFILMLLFTANAPWAQQILDGEAFDNLSRDTTMYFTDNGLFFGSEQFLPDRRTVWRAEDGSCVNGKWAEVDGDICFVYDNGDGPHCWEIVTDGEDMTVTSTNGTAEFPPLVLELSGQDTRPILCTGPAFGV